MRSFRVPMSLAALFAGIFSAAGGLEAQIRPHAFELTFSAGAFVPTGNEGLSPTSGIDRNATVLGSAHMSFNAPEGWITGEFEGGYAFERVQRRTATLDQTRGTRYYYATAMLLMGRSPRRPGVSFRAGAGPAIIYRRHSVQDPSVSQSNFGGIATANVRIPIDDQVGVRFDLQDLIYRADLGLGTKLRNDFLLTIGLSITY